MPCDEPRMPNASVKIHPIVSNDARRWPTFTHRTSGAYRRHVLIREFVNSITYNVTISIVQSYMIQCWIFGVLYGPLHPSVLPRYSSELVNQTMNSTVLITVNELIHKQNASLKGAEPNRATASRPQQTDPQTTSPLTKG